jgi:ribonuclease E
VPQASEPRSDVVPVVSGLARGLTPDGAPVSSSDSDRASSDDDAPNAAESPSAESGSGSDDDDSPKRGKRRRRGRRGSGGERNDEKLTNQKSDDSSPRERGQEAASDVQPRGARASEPKASEPSTDTSREISPLARGVVAQPAEPAESASDKKQAEKRVEVKPAIESAPRTLYSGRRGKAPPRGRGRQDDR